MNTNSTTAEEFKKTLPIFDFIDSNLPAQMKTPEGKKTMSKLFTGGIFLLVAGLFFYNFAAINDFFTSLLQFSATVLVLGVFSVIGIVFISRYKQIVGALDNAAKVKIFGAEKGFIRRNFMDQLNVLLEESKDTLIKVRLKLRDVDAARINVIKKAQDKEEERKNGQLILERISEDVTKLSQEQKALADKGYNEKAADKARELKEALNTATLRKAEMLSSEKSSKMYAQCGNQISKVMEVLKDNESAAKIYVGAITSSIKIIQDEVNVTSDISKATENLSDVFKMEGGMKFVEAMDAANSAISFNISSIRSNLQFVDENRGAIAGTMTVDELNSFTTQLKSGNMKTLNVAQVTDASYELLDSDVVAPELRIL